MKGLHRPILFRHMLVALLLAVLLMPAGVLQGEQDEGSSAPAHERHQKAPSYRFDPTKSPVVLKLLKMDHAVLRQEWKQQDKSIAEIAAERGISLEQLTEAVVKERSEQLDRAVAEGKLSAEDAREMKAKQKVGIQKRLQAKWSERKMHKRERLEQLARILQMKPDELNRELANGKSLAEVAKERNVPLDQVKDTMRSSYIQMIEQKASDGMLPPSKVDKWKQQIDQHLERMLHIKRSSHKHMG